MILPIAENHTLHTKILQQQIALTEPTRKRLWQQIVQQKIRQQARTLNLIGQESAYLTRLATQVKTGDSGNSEAIAAQTYWKLLFGKQFRRDVNLEGINSLLNYGYAIVRAMIARSICAAGLHPTLGLFHKNQYNPLCLADDLMEPFRPWVDHSVYQLAQTDQSLEVNQKNKQVLLNLLSENVIYEDKKMPFMIATHRLMGDLKRCYNKQQKKLSYPEMQSELQT